MDGNGRWAGRRGLPRTEGHTEGEENLARLVRIAVQRNIGWLTVFGFSTENWQRPRPEVRHILGLHEKLFGRVAELNELNVRIQWIGRPFDSPMARTPRYVQRAIRKAIADTANNTGMVLTVAFDYGGRSELVAAVEAARTSPEGITVDIDRRASLSSGAPARRRPRADQWRTAGVELPALAGRRRRDLLHRGAVAGLRRRRTRCGAGARSMNDDPVDALGRVTSELANAEDRAGQREMAGLVADAIVTKRHLVVQAGTGTGKTLAYLVPAIEADARIVVATATKALQDQLATKDLPFLAEHLGVDFDWAILKGRSNYVCLQRLREMSAGAQGQLELETMAVQTRAEIRRLAEWSGTTETGDMAELDWTPSDNAWRSVSVGSDECPGADRCPLGDPCFAEQARRRAAVADVVVVNTHLYGLNVASGGAILPEHDVVVFDEAHVLEDIMSDTVGVEIAPGRFTALSGVVRRILDDPELIGSIAEIAESLRDALSGHVGERLSTPLPDSMQEVLTDARLRLGRANEVLLAIETTGRGRQTAQAPRPDDDRPCDRATRRRDRRARGIRRVRVGLTRFPTPRGGPARRGPGDERGRVVTANGDPHERDDSVVARRSCRYRR